MRTRGFVRVVMAIGLLAGTGLTASAQSVPPYDPNTETQLFEYEVGPKTYFAVDDASLAAKGQVALDFMVTFLANPVTIYNVSQDETMITTTRTNVVKSMLAGEIGAAYGLSDRYQLGLSLPMVFSESGDGIDVMTAGKGSGLQISGLGDMRAEVKARIWEKNSMRLAGAVGLTLPTSFGTGHGGDSSSDYLGDNLPSFRGRIAWNFAQGRLSFGANAGVVLGATRTIYASKVGQQFTYGAAGGYGVTDKFSLVAESFGRVGMRGFDVDSSPMEVEGGVRVLATKAVAVVLGGGAGLIKGIGSPDLRVFASVGYEPDTRDSDHDGVANNRDKCPLVAEDKDGFEDLDGCPDDDNDHDMRPDGEDKCPDQAEDIDGNEDDDGCPDLDNDGDKIPDLSDRCPDDKEDGLGKYATDGCPQDKRDSDADGMFDDKDACPDDAEDMDGFEDGDGCPENDNDNDGVTDDADKCPVCPEDKDGVADDDGCPEDDADHDGIADAADKCPAEMEVINGVDDWDGCADDGGAVVADFDGDRINFVAPVSFDKKGLTKAGGVIADQAALQILQHPEVTLWTVAVGSKKDADARKHAAALLKKLQDRGVPLDRLHVVTAAGADAVGIGVEERSDADPSAPPVCPAGMEVQPRTFGAGGATTAPAMVATAPATTEPEPTPEVTPEVDTTEDAEPPSLAVVPPATDADSDGVGDDVDQCPNEPETVNGYLDEDGCKDDVPKALKKFTGVVKGINFKTGSAEIVKSSLKVLKQAVKVLAAFPDLHIEVAGHTDDVGKRAANIALSQARAESVMQYLVDQGVAPDHVTAHGYGPDRPLIPKKTKSARAKNRRVEFHILSGDGATATP